MSTNNQLVILKKGKKYCVHENFCVDNPFQPAKCNLLESFDTLEDAVSFANKYCNEWPYVEYGYYISDSCLSKKKPKRK